MKIKILTLLSIFTLHSYIFTSPAAVPLRWTVETSRVNPAAFDAYHGEELALEATMQSYGKPLAIPLDSDVKIFWQTNGMGSVYWSTNAWVTAESNAVNNSTFYILHSTFSPGMDPGANITGFIGVPGSIYRAAFSIRFRNSPGAVPSVLPMPVSTLDFATVEIRNAPYYTRGETDAKIIELSPAPGNYATVSNRAMSAVQSLSPALAYTTAVSNKLEDAVADLQEDLTDKLDLSGGRMEGDINMDEHSINNAWAINGVSVNAGGLSVTGDSEIGGGETIGGDLSVSGAAAVTGSLTVNGTITSVVDIQVQNGYSLLNVGNSVNRKANLLTQYTEGHLLSVDNAGDIADSGKSAADFQPAGSYLTSESDPTVNGKINTHNSSASAHSDIRSTLSTIQNNVSTWSAFWSGDDVRVTVTNYDSATRMPSLYLEYKQTNGTFRTVWDELTRFNSLSSQLADLTSALDQKADRAWGFYDSHTGGWAPDGYTWISSPKIAISAGMAYQKHLTTEGAIWVLESNGLVTETSGVTSNGFFRISDDEGNSLFEIVKGDKRTVGAAAGSCQTLAGYAITHLQIGYPVASDTHPNIYVTTSLHPANWKAEDDADCPATVTWSGSSGNYTAVVAGKTAQASLFVKAEYQIGGNTYIKNSAPVSLQKIVIGDTEYTVGTATISGHTVLTLTP